MFTDPWEETGFFFFILYYVYSVIIYSLYVDELPGLSPAAIEWTF